jgi:hypothetical protein
VVLALDRTLRRFGGAPSYALTDNERTVSVGQVCGIAVRNPKIVAASRHYGLAFRRLRAGVERLLRPRFESPRRATGSAAARGGALILVQCFLASGPSVPAALQHGAVA